MLAVTPTRHEDLAAMVLELQTNRAVLYGLTNWFAVFVFTGGRVPTASWSVGATASCLEHPAPADGFAISEIQRYRCLVQTISDLGQMGTGPRTLHCRRSLGDRFAVAASELRLVADALESSIAKAIQEPKE